MKLIFFSSIILASACAIAERTVYLEEFDRLGDYVESFNENVSITESPASLKALYINAQEPTRARRGFFNISTPPASERFTVFAKYCFKNDAAPHEFTLELFFGDKNEPEVRTVTIAESGSYFGKTPSSEPLADGMPGFLGNGQWNNLSITVDGGKAKIFVFRNGIQVEEKTGELSIKPLIGWNIIAKSPLFFDAFRINDDCLRPFQIGDATDWLKRLASFQETLPETPEGAVVMTNRQELVFDPVAGHDICFMYRCGQNERTRANNIKLILTNGTIKAITFINGNKSNKNTKRIFDTAKEAFINVNTNAVLNDALTTVSMPGVRACVFTRPNCDYRYETYQLPEIFAGWDNMPSASEHTIKLRLHPLDSTWCTNEVWIDSRYAGELTLDAPIAKFKAQFSGKPFLCAYQLRDELNVFADTKFLPLDVNGLARPFGSVGYAATISAVQQIPFIFAKPGNALNLAFCRQNLGSFALECNGYLSRSAFDGMPSSMHFSVPVKQYIRAHAVCIVDRNAPDDFVPVVTARLTHYMSNGGRSQAATEATVTLPENKSDPLPPNVSIIGDDNGNPIYSVTFDFDIGSIQDLTSMLQLDHLDFDFVGPLWDKDTYYLNRGRSPSPSKQSSVQVMAATLEETEVAFTVFPNRNNSVYYPDEQAGATINITPTKGSCNVNAIVTDIDGKIVETHKFSTSEKTSRNIKFKVKASGHYDVIYTVADKTGKPIITHKASFALIPADTRKAGYDSPYYIWNFGGAHGTPSKLDDYGDMLCRMGVRRTLLDDRNCETNQAVQKYKLTLGQFPYYRLTQKGFQTREESVAATKALIKNKMAKFPHCRTALIFHESGGGQFPLEVIDGKTIVTPEMKESDAKRARSALDTAEIWREIDPGVRLVVGNSGLPLGLLAQLFRAGYSEKYIDALGDETVGLTQPPERSVAYPAWTLQKLAKSFGYTNAVPDAPFEWKSRLIRHTGERKLAAYVTRDALIAHAWNYTLVPLCGLTEMANSYYDTVWGGGSFTRWPLAYPAQAFSAAATLTSILDCAKFTQLLDTGSLTTYCLEFKRPDGTFVYALWTARVKVDVKLDIAPGFRLTDMTGRSIKPTGNIVAAEDTPLYIETKSPISAVSAIISGDFPANSAQLPEKAEVVQPLLDTSNIEIVNTPDPRIEIRVLDPPNLSFHRIGEFAVSTTNTADGIKCLALTRTTTAACPELMQEYTFLKFQNAKPATGEPNTIGLWIFGNSSWGKLYFEITDAEGEKWFSAGTGGYGCTVYDWPEQASINFDGWHFVEFPITEKSPIKVFSPGENQWQWQRDGNKGNGRIDYPITVSGLGVGMYPHVLNLLKMEPTSRTIMLKDITLY